MIKMELKDKIRTVPHFPKEGIMFKDVTTLLQDSHAFKHVIKEMLKYFEGKQIDVIASAESRGFIFGSVLAYELGASFVPLRKPGKLPYKKIKQEFTTEYSTDAFEIHEDALKQGDKVLVVDDLLATGGTSKAAAQLVEKLGGEVIGFAFLIELSFLKGRKKLDGYDILSLIDYEKEE
ncbi:MAG: adenine phosphoribosyltransferase [bacterium]|nr:adenine phosphoribosyltransferase [bacterium]